MGHELKVRLIEAHAKRSRRYECLHFVVDELGFQFRAIVVIYLRVIGQCINAARLQETSNAIYVSDSQCVDDS